MALNDDGTAQDVQPADDIRSTLAAALAEQETDVTDTPAKPAKAAATDDGAADAGDGAEKPAPKRGEGGKFVKTDAKADDDTAAKPDEAAEKPEGEKPEVDPADKEQTEAAKAEAEITGKWSAKDKELLKALPQEGRDLILRRHKEMEGAFTRKTQAVEHLRKEYEPVSKLLEPWQDQMKQSGYTPQSLITAWANVEKKLMDPRERVGVVAGLIKGYQVNMGDVAKALGLKPQERQQTGDGAQQLPAAEQQTGQAQLPPEIVNQLTTLQQRLDAQDREKADAQRRTANEATTRVMTEIENFKSAQDDKGNMLHPHFEDVESDMTDLASAAIAAKRPVPSLQELYEKAVFANPSTREQAIAAKLKAQQDASAKEARDKAVRAKRASSSVSGAPGTGQAPSGQRKGEQSLREQLLEAASERESAI